MKKTIAILFFALAKTGFAQSDMFTIPERTPISMILTEDVKEGKNSVGTPARFVVAEDVKVDGLVVVAKNTLVHATVTISGKRELRVDLADVPAVDGTPLKLMDCWKFTTAAQNLNGKGALLPKNTTKNCFTIAEVKIKKGGGKF
ncbi:MAG: hypothetical protein IPH78_05110 [Bacteroidetes bacterium]|nr:hypothetical protein [Bacteroidota bacterium]